MSDAALGGFEAARLTVKLGALVENYKIAQRLAGTAAAASVVKADAYGTGMAQAVPALVQAGCDTFFVARLEEGIALRPLAPEARIFVLDGAQPDWVSALISHRLTPVLNSIVEIAGWSAASRAMQTQLDAAIHFDTGMNRLGLPGAELALLAAEHAKRLEGIRVVLLMSHLACADAPDATMNRVQLERFKTGLAMLPAAPASLAATCGLLLGKEFGFDMVRPGVGLYGGNPYTDKSGPFVPAVRLTARILQLHGVPKGETVGYGATFRTKRSTRLAVVGLGYADGLPRTLSNRAAASVRGVRVPAAGRVSMDLMTLDVTDVPGPLETGTEVEIIGETMRLEELAAAAGTIPYEILTSLTRRAQRVYEAAP